MKQVESAGMKADAYCTTLSLHVRTPECVLQTVIAYLPTQGSLVYHMCLYARVMLPFDNRS